MCLEKANVVTLKEDKIVYKVVVKCINGNLFSPFQWKPCYISDDVQHAVINYNSSIKEFNGNKVVALPSLYVSSDKYNIYGGVFHSFENYKDAFYVRDKLDEKHLIMTILL